MIAHTLSGIRHTMPIKLTSKAQEVLTHIVTYYGYLLSRYGFTGKDHSWAELAEMIEYAYAMDNPRNAYCVEFLRNLEKAIAGETLPEVVAIYGDTLRLAGYGVYPYDENFYDRRKDVAVYFAEIWWTTNTAQCFIDRDKSLDLYDPRPDATINRLTFGGERQEWIRSAIKESC